MASPALILTVDYEIFGNGTGCVKKCVIDPAERMMAAAENYGASLTFFVDALEFIAMEQYSQTFEAAETVKKQLGDAISRGHDVQLHLHPQWDGAKLDQNNRWQLAERKWRIGDLAYDDVSRLIEQGKRWLEKTLYEADPAYRCLAFRAGGWGIQPSGNVVPALAEHGISIDSSVAPGLRNRHIDTWFDFTDVPQQAMWSVKSDVCEHAEKDGQLLELPIAAGRIPILKHVKHLLRQRTVNREQRFALGCQGEYTSPSGKQGFKLPDAFKKVENIGKTMLDFSAMPASLNAKVLETWLQKMGGGGEFLPAVGISHTKNFSDRAEAEFRLLLETLLKKYSDIGFLTIKDCYN